MWRIAAMVMCGGKCRAERTEGRAHQGRMQRRCARVREPHPNHASAVEGGEARAATGGPGTRVTRPARWARHAWQRRRDGHEYHESWAGVGR